MRIVLLWVLIVVGTHRLAWAQEADAKKPQRGFSYPGFQRIENPFEKPGDEYWVAPGGDDAATGTRDKPWKTLSHAS
ncbi:MAG: hypothetical protein VX877_00020, partial [Planctomycetota bacterium]|nr:hypothetical protein [Planctomycetota bacterium]